jgi:hypothetical protein
MLFSDESLLRSAEESWHRCDFNNALSGLRESGYWGPLRRFWVILSLILATFWVPASSHGLLQRLGLIHERHAAHAEAHHHDSESSHEHDGNSHDLADGICRTEASGVQVPVATADFIQAAWVAVVWGLNDTLIDGLDRSGPAPPGTSPPELLQVWQFSLRTALPVRAPSLAS